MTTDELLAKLPSHIGRNRFHGFYMPDNKRGADKVGFIFTMMVKIGVLLMVVKVILFVSILMLRSHHTTTLFVMVVHLMKHCKVFMIGV